MSVIVPIVEGPGDAEAIPVLLRKVLAYLNKSHIHVATPKNAHGCSNIERPGGLEKFVEHAFRTKECGGVLLVLDTDGDVRCPKTLAPALASRIRKYGARKPVAIVFAKNEYEVWFIASVESIAGKPIKGNAGIAQGVTAPTSCESVRNPKAWIEKNFSNKQKYKETLHQAPLSALVDPATAAPRSRSFRRLIHAVEELVASIEASLVSVTPK